MGACWVQQGDRGMVRMISFLLRENETATVVLKTPENINDILGKTTRTRRRTGGNRKICGNMFSGLAYASEMTTAWLRIQTGARIECCRIWHPSLVESEAGMLRMKLYCRVRPKLKNGLVWSDTRFWCVAKRMTSVLCSLSTVWGYC